MDSGLGSVAFVVVEGQVVHDLIDDEVVVVHLGTGSYYSLRGPSLAAWVRLTTPSTIADVASVIAAAAGFEVDRAQVASVALLSYLLTEDLIMSQHPVDVGGDAFDALEPDLRDALMVEKFTDVQELLTIDPVHDVDDRGWPSTESTANV